jgi:hypothetical protein
MTYKQAHPKTRPIDEDYPEGVRLTEKEMKPYEASLDRLKGLDKWFLAILRPK